MDRLESKAAGICEGRDKARSRPDIILQICLMDLKCCMHVNVISIKSYIVQNRAHERVTYRYRVDKTLHFENVAT